jgi:hypothetical protein
MHPVRLYVNIARRIPGLDYAEILFPFWGMPTFSSTMPYAQATYRYSYRREDFALVEDITQADFYLLPHDYWHLKHRYPDALAQMLDEAREANKPILIEAAGDVHGVVDVPHSVVLRIDQYRFALPQNEIKIPVICEDLLETHRAGKFQARAKGDVPIVGFVGWGRLSLKQRVRTFIKEIPHRLVNLFNSNYAVYVKGVFWRERAVKIFTASPRIKTNFIIRTSYSGNVKTAVGDMQKNRVEFVENILYSDYTLIVRGDANEATRFYETLSLGRIPVLIDTAVVLPLEHLINYREFCVIIDHRELSRAPDILADFHATLTPESFVAMQEKARYIFEHYLRFDAFSKHLAEMLKERLKVKDVPHAKTS